jgi:hypothetical protein
MVRRRGGEEELPFSLDSFLDIVANLVGILIRLIVMVGLSVRALPGPSQAMKEAESNKSDAEYVAKLDEWKRTKEAIESANAKADADHRRKIESREQELAERRRAEESLRAKQRRIDEEYDARKRAVAERLAVLQAFEKQAAEMAGELNELAERKSKEADLLDRELAAARRIDVQAEEETKSLAELRSELGTAQRELDAERLKRESLDDQIAELRRQIAEIEAAPKPVQRVLHDATSVASRVEIEEVHYRIKNGRIAPTYMSDLLELLKRRVRTAIETKSEVADGALGPIGGFALQYELDRKAATLTMRAQTGVGNVDVDLKRFRLVPESDELGEPLEQALQTDSAFWRSLESVDPAKRVVTFWVYPDGFSAAKPMEEALHRRGFAVAMRPMPEGADITGSPSGSVSDAK